MTVRIITGDALTELRKLPDESVHCCVTSPPYYGLRDYGTARWGGGSEVCDHKGMVLASSSSSLAGYTSETVKVRTHSMPQGQVCSKCGARRIDRQIGLEPSPDEYVAALVAVFREVRRVLRKDGTLWLNIGDSYAQNEIRHRNKESDSSGLQTSRGKWSAGVAQTGRKLNHQVKPKDLIGIPWALAFALRADGWWLRQEVIWHKPAPMPESVLDRCTRAHESIFLLAKSERYYFDAAAIAEPLTRPEEADRITPAKFGGAAKYVEASKQSRLLSGNEYRGTDTGTRNKRSVWTVPPSPFPEAHFATFPPALIEPCIMAGCPKGGAVLDPFGGAGTTGLVSDRLGRDAVLIELNPEYAQMAERRLHNDAPLFADVAMHPPASECAA